MAAQRALKAPKLSAKAQKALVDYCSVILQRHQGLTELRNKMEEVDKAYARYKGGDAEAGTQPCTDVFAKDNVVPPIVVSQVDSYVAYLAEV